MEKSLKAASFNLVHNVSFDRPSNAPAAPVSRKQEADTDSKRDRHYILLESVSEVASVVSISLDKHLTHVISQHKPALFFVSQPNSLCNHISSLVSA